MNLNTKLNIGIIALLIVIFIIYNFFIYNSQSQKFPIILSKTEIQGQNLWQKNNCWTCHQIYGLGGYLGPDLTNVYSENNKGPAYISSILNSGIKSMPKYNFSKNEIDALISYFKIIDSTGYFPNHKVEFQGNGLVKFKYKNEQ